MNPTLLVVDDEEAVLDAVKRLFFREPVRVFTAESAAEALEILETEEIHVILSDNRMPEVSGIELLASIRERWPDIVRIMFSGQSDMDDVVSAVNDGAIWYYVNKPWEPEELRQVTREALRKYETDLKAKYLIADLEQQVDGLCETLTFLQGDREEQARENKLEVLNQLATTLNHEINNPLAAILGNAQLLLGECRDLGEKPLSRLQVIEQLARRIAEVTANLDEIEDPVTQDYACGLKMLDLEASRKAAQSGGRQETAGVSVDRDAAVDGGFAETGKEEQAKEEEDR